MEGKPIFPQLVFAVALLFAALSAALNLERFKLENQIQVDLDQLRQEQQSTLIQAEHIRARGKPEIFFKREKLASYFDTLCRTDSKLPLCEAERRIVVGLMPKPAEGASSEAIELARESESRIVKTSQKIAEASDKREQLEKPTGIDKDIIRAILSVVLVLAALFVILSRRYPQGSEKWAFGTIGTIIGYWLG